MSLISDEYIVSRDVETDPDFSVFSKHEKRVFAMLQSEVRNFDMFRFPGTYFLNQKFRIVGKIVVDFANGLKYNHTEGAIAQNVKRDLLAILLILEFVTNNVFICTEKEMAGRCSAFHELIFTKINEFMTNKNIDEKTALVLSTIHLQFCARLRLLKREEFTNPVVPYSDEWIEACGF